jgi:hypothetical protein
LIDVTDPRDGASRARVERKTYRCFVRSILIYFENSEIHTPLLAECAAGGTRKPMRHLGTYIALSAADTWSSRLGDGRVVRAAEPSSHNPTRQGSIRPE